MQYLVDFHHNATDPEISQYLTDNGCTVLKEWDNFDRVFLVECNSAPVATSIVERLVEELPMKVKPLMHINHVSGETNPYIGTHNNPNLPTITISTTDEHDWWKNYSYQTPKFDQPTYTINRLGQNTTIYLMDSGIELTHPEFEGANIVNLYTVTPGDYNDYRGHGTALASVMVGKTCGITAATIKNVKIYDQNHTTLQSEFLDALDAVINDHVDGKFAILNCSWVIEKNEYIEHKLRIAFDEGIHIMAAAGNQGTSIEDVTPASMMEALTTGAYNKDLLPCDFSNYTGGSSISVTTAGVNTGELDGWAPGEQIWSASLLGQYAYAAGTSIATAIASAVAAANTHYMLDDQGIMVPPYNEGSLSTIDPNGAGHVFIKQDLLDLSDPKYSTSINLIAGLMDRAENTRQYGDHLYAKVRVNSSNKYTILGTIFNPILTKRIDWIVPLPEEFLLNQIGKLVVNPSHLQNPAPGQNYTEYNCSLKRVAMDDTEETVNLKILVLPENFDPGQLPSEDPAIDILLQSSCVGSAQCQNSGMYITCSDGCTWLGLCCTFCGSPKGPYYQCFCVQLCP